MSASNENWVLQQLDTWVGEGLISPEAARVLRGRLEARVGSSLGLGALMLGSVGALMVGVGLIVLISHNWDEFSRIQRLACAFVPLLAAQMWTGFLLGRGPIEPVWKLESAGLLQTMAVGACIGLVSQIYHIGGEWTRFLVVWCLLSLPMVWALRVRFVAVFYLLGIGVWALGQVKAAQSWYVSPVIYPVLLLGVWPYCPGFRFERVPGLLMRRALALSGAAGLAAIACYAVSKSALNTVGASERENGVVVWLLILSAAVLSLFPVKKAALNETLTHKPHVQLSGFFLIIYAFSATFIARGEACSRGALDGLSITWGKVLLFAFVALAGLAARQGRLALLALVVIPLVPLAAWISGVSLSLLSTLHLGALGLALIVLDFYGKPASPRVGAMLLTALISVRMADSKFSLVTKGTVFVCAGIAFLAFNHFMSRRSQQNGRSLG